jgi:hypothetical protein
MHMTMNVDRICWKTCERSMTENDLLPPNLPLYDLILRRDHREPKLSLVFDRGVSIMISHDQLLLPGKILDLMSEGSMLRNILSNQRKIPKTDYRILECDRFMPVLDHDLIDVFRTITVSRDIGMSPMWI